MSEIVNLDHETGDLTQYTSTVTDGGDLSVTAAAALAGTGYGLACLIDDNNTIYAQKNFTALTGTAFRARFYIDPNEITINDTTSFAVMTLAGSSDQVLVTVQIAYWSGYGTPSIIAELWDDSAALQQSSWHNITDEAHYVEVLTELATGASANDGRLTLWIDGVQKQQLTGLDFYTRGQPDRVLLGCIGPNAAGTLYLDELLINDDGEQIGPVVVATPGISLRALRRNRRRKH